jgi:hypothetical protein
MADRAAGHFDSESLFCSSTAKSGRVQILQASPDSNGRRGDEALYFMASLRHCSVFTK